MRTRATLSLIAAVAATSPALADPVVTSYPQAMADGARRMVAKDFAGAVLAFQAALDARPHDGRALAELSWASFSAGDLAAAEASAGEASSEAREPQLRAMAFFGHVDESATIVCGVGASQRPSCVGPILSDWSETEDHGGKDDRCTTRPTFNAGFHCRTQLRGDVLELTRDPGKLDNYDHGVQVGPRASACETLPTFGTHTLVF